MTRRLLWSAQFVLFSFLGDSVFSGEHVKYGYWKGTFNALTRLHSVHGLLAHTGYILPDSFLVRNSPFESGGSLGLLQTASQSVKDCRFGWRSPDCPASSPPPSREIVQHRKLYAGLSGHLRQVP
jgi:hypothetical protein